MKLKTKVKTLLFTVSLFTVQCLMADPDGNSKPMTIIKAAGAILLGCATAALAVVLMVEGWQIFISKEFSFKRIGAIVGGAILCFCGGYLTAQLITGM
jgi:hypothetical protein